MTFCFDCDATWFIKEEETYTALPAMCIPEPVANLAFKALQLSRSSLFGTRCNGVRSEVGKFWESVRANLKWRHRWAERPLENPIDMANKGFHPNQPGADAPSWVPTDVHDPGPDPAVIFDNMVQIAPNGEGEQNVVLAEQMLVVCAWFTDNCNNYDDMQAMATDFPPGSKDRILRDCFGTTDPFRFTNKGKGRAHEEPDPSRRRIGEAFTRDLQRRYLKSQKVLVTAQGIVRNARLASTPTATPATSTGTTVGAPSDRVGGARSKSAPSKANSPLGPPGIPLSDPSGAASSDPSGAVQNPPLHTDYAAFFAQEREHQGAQALVLINEGNILLPSLRGDQWAKPRSPTQAKGRCSVPLRLIQK